MTLWPASNTSPTPSGSSLTFGSGSRSSVWSCIPTRPGSSSSGAMPPGSCGPGRRETGDVRLFGLHALLREEQKRGFLAQAEDHLEEDAGQACRGQRPDQVSSASAHPRTGQMARIGGARTPRLLRRARQYRHSASISTTGDPVLVRGVTAPQPAHPDQLDSDGPPGNDWLPPARAMHPFPIVRFNVRTQGRSPVR